MNAGEQHKGRASAFQAEDRGVRLSSPAPTLTQLTIDMNQKGYAVFPEFISQELVRELKKDLIKSYSICREVQIKNGIEMAGAGHHIIIHGASFLKYLLEFEKLNGYMEAYFGGKYILNAFGGNILEAGLTYASHIHRDIRTFSGDLRLMMNTIIMLDDFTEGNGATWLMGGGHKWKDKPNDSDFNTFSFQVIGKAGSLVCFNSNMWHKAGENKTDKPRMAITPIFCRPFIKPQFDYAKSFEGVPLSPYLSQLIGMNSRIPASLEEFYREDRAYKGDQG